MSNSTIRQLAYAEHIHQQTSFPIVVLLDNVRGPNNVGGIFRIADALGVSFVALCGATPAPPNKLLRKVARGAELHTPSQYYPDANEAIELYKAEKYTLIALEIATTSNDIKTLDYTQLEKIVLIAGGEKMGVSTKILEQADLIIHIPMLGHGLSMNVANSVAIAVYEITKQWIEIKQLNNQVI